MRRVGSDATENPLQQALLDCIREAVRLGVLEALQDAGVGIPGPAVAHPGGQLLTVDEVAERLRVPRKAVYELVSKGALRAIRVGRRLRVPEKELLAWEEGQEALSKGSSGHARPHPQAGQVLGGHRLRRDGRVGQETLPFP